MKNHYKTQKKYKEKRIVQFKMLEILRNQETEKDTFLTPKSTFILIFPD